METVHNLSATLQDYLEAILNLSANTPVVRVTDLASYLHVSKPTATETVKHLTAQKFIEHERYGPLCLTEKGREQATKIRHRHEIIKKFLVSVLGVDTEIADQEACLMEHAISSNTTDKLVCFMESTLV